MQVTIGHDAEVFVAQRTGKNRALQIVPSCGLVGGTKKAPLTIPNSRFGTTYQEDNVTVEFGTAPIPAKSRNVSQTFYESYNELGAFLKGKGLAMVPAPFHTFDEEVLKARPETMIFGCDPDFLAYSRGEMRTPPDPVQLGPNRCAAGHIHIGYDVKESGIPPRIMVMLLELTAYIPYLRYDKQGIRRKFYGIAGLHRPKPYGVEWRTPSNFWLNEFSFVDAVAATADMIVNRPLTVRRIFKSVNWEVIQNAIATETVSEEAHNYYRMAGGELQRGRE